MSATSTVHVPHHNISDQLRQRRTLDQIGMIVLVFSMAVCIAIYVLVPVQALGWLRTPFIGALLRPDATVSQQILPTLTLSFRPGETLTALDGEPVASTAQLQQRLSSEYAAGQQVTLSFTTSTGTQRDAAITLTTFPIAWIINLLLLPSMLGLAYIAVGLWVYRNRRETPIGRTFFNVCILAALILVTTFDLYTTHRLYRIWAALFPLLGGALAVLALYFPNESKLAATFPERRWWPIALAGAAAAAAQIGLSLGPQTARLTLTLAQALCGLGVGIFAIGMLYRSIFTLSPAVREQSRVALIGVTLTALPIVLHITGLIDLPVHLLLACPLIFVAIVAYTLLQYNVLDTGRVLGYATTYSIMAVVVVLGYALVMAGINQLAAALFFSGVPATHPAAVALLTFVVVLAFEPARRRLQGVIDGLFFKTRSEYETRLTAFRHSLNEASSLGTIVWLLKQQLRETLLPTHTYIFLRDAHTGDFAAAGEGSRPDTDIRFELRSGLVNALSTTRDILFLEFNKPLAPELVEDHARLAVLRTPVLAPLQGQEGLAGWIAVGSKRSNETFNIEDLRFIQALADQASLAVERAQVIADLEQRVRELDVLSQVSQAVNFTTDPDVLMELIYTQTSKLIDTTNFYIIMHNAQTSSMNYAFFLESDERYEEREGIAWPDNLGLAAEVIRTGRPIRTDDYLAECANRSVRPHGSKHYAWMGVPLNAGSQTLGVMIVASYTQGVSFTDEQLKVFWAIADQAATALDKARLFRETEERAFQLDGLNRISQELSSTLKLEDLLKRIMRSAVNILNAEAGSLFLVDEGSGELVFRVVEGGAQDLVGQRIPSGRGIVGQAAESAQPVISNNVARDERFFGDVDKVTDFRTESLLAVPMLVQDRIIGVVEVINRRDGLPFREEEAALLTTFAAQAAVAIENARLYEATDEQLRARVDELQNLQRIDRELNRTLNFDRVINITLDWALRTTGCGTGAIAMLEADQTALRFMAAHGYSQKYLARYADGVIPLLEAGSIGRVLTSGKPEFLTELTEEERTSEMTTQPSVAQITVPILRANQPVGALSIESNVENLLTVQDFDFIQRLAEHAAVAIENARLVDEIEAANKSKTEFISFVAHELKNPMTSIRGYTDLLKSGSVGEVNDMQVQFLNTIRSNVDRMTRLVSDLADVARIETGNLRIEFAPVSVAQFVDETLRGMQSQIEEKTQTLTLEIEDNLPPVQADYTRILQVMTNLVSNAHKYTPEGGQIMVGAALDTFIEEETGIKRPVVRHWVRDTGIGMSEEDLEQLFTKFFRTQRGKDMAQGTGLGLNITRSLIEAHNGRIWVESKEGAGTTFYFTLPAAANSPS